MDYGDQEEGKKLIQDLGVDLDSMQVGDKVFACPKCKWVSDLNLGAWSMKCPNCGHKPLWFFIKEEGD